ncbi:MAG: SCP2 sterol-binding domain-containing protein [Rhodocyclaceae bacterium]|nr:SCP2 sterol-binding domain-containing protein [Rhodocyclaceae bacterium]
MIENFKLPDFTLPAPFARLGDKLPQLPPTLALVTALNLALGRLIPREPLEMLKGKRFTIRVKDAGMTLRFGYNGRSFHPVFDPRPADLTLSARARDFLALLAREEDPDTLFFNRRLLMEGDTDLGLLVKNTLDGVELPRITPARLVPGEFFARLRQRLSAPRGI